jgi:hypothetical protein
LALIEAQGSETPCKSLRAFLIFISMKIFLVKSPSGKILPTWAETIYHAIQKAMVVDGFNYNQIEYNKLNPKKK